MLEVKSCDNCNENIKVDIAKGFTHIKCKKCGSCYQLDKNSLKFYSFIPLIAVFVSVYLSMNYVLVKDIFVKTIFILSVSYGIYTVLCLMLIKFKKFQYDAEE